MKIYEIQEREQNSIIVRSPLDVASLIFPMVEKFDDKEHLLTVSLNGNNEIISIRIISIGIVNKSLVHPREVFKNAIIESAANIILIHNHPSGNLEPSNEDIETTESLIKASEILGIGIFDHIIVNKKFYFSFKEREILFK